MAKVMEELLNQALCGRIPAFAYVAEYGPNDHRVGVVGNYRRSPEAAQVALHMMDRRIQWENSFTAAL